MSLSNLLDCSLDMAAVAGLRPLVLDAEMAYAEKTLPSGNLSCRAQRWRCAAAELRVAWLESPKIQVLSCFVYPVSHVALPLYAMELVQLGAKPIIAVIDAVAPAQDPAQAFARACLAEAHAAHPELQNADDPPDWFQDCRSGVDFFVRPASQTEFAQMGSLHVSLLMSYLKALPAAARRTPSETAAFEHFSRHYKDHHAANSPGLPLMHKSFGPAWTERFMQQCFFH